MSFKVLSSGQVLGVHPDDYPVIVQCHLRGLTHLPQLGYGSTGFAVASDLA